MHIVYAAFGRAGYHALKILLQRDDISHIHCFTYDHPENKSLLQALEKHGIPHTLKRLTTKRLKAVCTSRPDFVISMHYRDRIPKGVLEFATMGGMNLHPALLPKYRGCFSGVWALINGESETGITYHYMNEKFDDGKIILQYPVKIENHDTGHSLFHKLIDIGLAYFNSAVSLATDPNFKGSNQVGEPSYYGREVPFGGQINESWSPDQIDRFIRAMYFPGKPSAYLLKDGEKHYFDTMEQYLNR